MTTRSFDWPGEERRSPRLSSATWLVRHHLAAWLTAEAAAAGAERGRYRVLDVGCGPKPYYPFFREWADPYVGVDVVAHPAADLVGAVESLPSRTARSTSSSARRCSSTATIRPRRCESSAA